MWKQVVGRLWSGSGGRCVGRRMAVTMIENQVGGVQNISRNSEPQNLRKIDPTNTKVVSSFQEATDITLLSDNTWILHSQGRKMSAPEALGLPLFTENEDKWINSLLQEEDEFHKLADSTIEHLLEKFEEFGDSVDIDGFDIDYGNWQNQVLTLKLGTSGTYVLNKQTPNRQLWLSSPVSGPSRFNWDQDAKAWVYRRTKANLLDILEKELQQLCGEPIDLS